MSAAPDAVPANLKSRLKASYDDIAPRYNEWTAQHSHLRLHYLERLLPLLPAEGAVAVLELGCGCGVPVTRRLLADPRVRVVANDLSSTQMALARANLAPAPAPSQSTEENQQQQQQQQRRVRFIEGDMAALAFAPASFDAVVGLYSLLHLPRAEQGQMLGRAAAWLRPGGVLLANFAAEAAAGLEADRWLGERDWMFWSGWGADGTLERVRDAGLEVLVGDVVEDVVDASFLWVIARK